MLKSQSIDLPDSISYYAFYKKNSKAIKQLLL